MRLERVAKSLDVHPSTVRHTVYKRRQYSSVGTLTRSQCQAKMTPKAEHRIINEVKKKLKVSFSPQGIIRAG